MDPFSNSKVMGDIGSLKSLLNGNCFLFLLEKLEWISFRGQEPESEGEGRKRNGRNKRISIQVVVPAVQGR